MNDAATRAECMQRFLHPQHALLDGLSGFVCGHAGTPAADAVCEMYLLVDEGRIVDMRFALYGPPVAIACADWLCEYLIDRTIMFARGLSMQEIQAALSLASQERYAAILVLDALADAVEQLEA